LDVLANKFVSNLWNYFPSRFMDIRILVLNYATISFCIWFFIFFLLYLKNTSDAYPVIVPRGLCSNVEILCQCFNRIQGTSGVELSTGLHWYLKHWCLIHISWEKTGGLQLSSVPKVGSLPHVPSAGILVQRPVPLSYYQNAVTSSYSYAWWSWERWEKEIDWMVLQGVNLPLAFNGQEAIWQKVFERYNISRRDLDDFFGGPAFLSWSRMGNLHGWGGPLPQSWLDDQLVLQKKILARMYSFGMTPGIFRRRFKFNPLYL
ncbi:unnamed protein product, partial [Musa acuminata var. zebrina]